ncbi:uncharacterized protein GGS25DRAFT_524584 [Hypoxylon fragiforme]|uniref:uncharacterized protein n=1 Tax=Hypoxylon fragiforme TaxID=63214 RepID=UPI0020C666EE|nr:uncharacterized protein GGS25DRAFT_524584 [Hypoxylon fragiforme]KAI2605076.1 hypothetical protein GGS25DRAFT_524584 [Hypoxylon fragiforme]
MAARIPSFVRKKISVKLDKSEKSVSGSSSPGGPQPDNDVYTTSSKIKCSECGNEDYFEYVNSEEDANCKECRHKKCDDCKIV